MTIHDLTRWEPRHTEKKLGAPRSSVSALAPSAVHAVALDLACGQGRHTRALLAAGYAVIALDVSRNALEHLKSFGTGADARLLCVQADVDNWPLRQESFDAVVIIDFLDRRLYATLKAALRPGGQLLVDTVLDAGHPNAEGPSNADNILTPGELARAFHDFEILEDDEQDGPTARAIFRARKRAQPR